MGKFWSAAALVALLGAVPWGPSVAQETTAPRVLEVGEMAPDFALVGSTRYGILRNPVRLSDYRGTTVVLAFFFRARTRG